VCEALLKHGGATHSKENDGCVPLLLAARNGRVDVVVQLLQHKADVNATANYGQTPLHEACIKGWTAVVTTLLKKGARADVKDSLGLTPLEIAKKKADFRCPCHRDVDQDAPVFLCYFCEYDGVVFDNANVYVDLQTLALRNDVLSISMMQG